MPTIDTAPAGTLALPDRFSNAEHSQDIRRIAHVMGNCYADPRDEKVEFFAVQIGRARSSRPVIRVFIARQTSVVDPLSPPRELLYPLFLCDF